MEINGVDLECVYHNAFVQAKHSYQEAYNYLMEVIDNLNKQDAVHLKKESNQSHSESQGALNSDNHTGGNSGDTLRGCVKYNDGQNTILSNRLCNGMIGNTCPECQERHKSEEVKG